MTSSLWIDELGTWWVIQGTARDTIARAAAVQGQSPVYYLIVWLTRHVTGHTEFGLRVPSLIFLLLALLVMYRMARRLADTETAMIAMITFVVWPSIAFQASDARPYALAVLLTVTSTWALIVWLDSNRRGPMAAYVGSAAGLLYVHPLFGLVLVPQFLYVLARDHEASTHVTVRTAILALGGIAVLGVPVGIEVIALWRRHQDWLVPKAITVPWVIAILAPPALIGAAVIGGITLSGRATIGRSLRRFPRSSIVLLIGWLLIPVTVLVGLSLFSPIRLLQPRYLASVAPAGALLAAIAIRAVEPARIRRILIVIVVVLSVFDLAQPFKSGDMQGASTLARSVASPRSVVFLVSGFQESKALDWYSDPTKRGLLAAATSFYPVPGTIVPLPSDLDASTLHFVRQQVDRSILGADDVVVLSVTGSAYGPWFDEYMELRGWTGHSVGEVNLITVTEFIKH